MNILFISSYYPFKDTRFGGSKRLYYLARELQKYGRVDIICHDACRELTGGGLPQERDFERLLYIPLKDARGLAGRLLRPGVNIGDFLAANSGLIREFIGAAEYDAALLAFPMALSYIGTVLPPRLRPVVYLEDDLLLETVRAEKGGNVLDLYRALRLAQLRSFYRDKLSRVDAFVSISPQEQEITKRYFPYVNSRIVKYGVPLEEYPFLDRVPRDFTVGFIGNFQHRPNAAALEWFLREVLPALKQAMPGIRAFVAGKNIPAAARTQYAGDNSLAWEENVPGVSGFYEKISVFVNPIVSGRGLRTKCIEAAAFGRPIVSTGLGAEGLEDLSVAIAGGAGEFAESCKKFKNDSAHYAAVAAANRKTVERQYSLDAVGRQLVSILQGKC